MRRGGVGVGVLRGVMGKVYAEVAAGRVFGALLTGRVTFWMGRRESTL